MKKIYLDNAATTAIHPKVIEKMIPFMKENYGNPSSIHSFGRNVRVALEEARELSMPIRERSILPVEAQKQIISH